MYGLPSLQTIVALGTIPVLIAFALVNYKQNVFSVASFFVICANTFWGIWFYLAHMYTDWKRTEYSEEGRKPIADLNALPVPVPVRTGYDLQTVGVKLDTVRLFNRTLIAMRNGNLKVTMTEDFWIDEKIEDESRWNKIGGKGRTDFVDVMERGIRFGAYKTVGGQGKRVPADWRKIRQLEQGHPLPD